MIPMPELPSLSNWADFKVHLAQVEAVRSSDFAMGAEMGFGCAAPDAELDWFVRGGMDNAFDKSLVDAKRIRRLRSATVAAGIEYGELLAEKADVRFLAEARTAFLKAQQDARA